MLELIDTTGTKEALEANDASLNHIAQFVGIARNHSTPEGDIDEDLATGCVDLRSQVGHARRRWNGIQWHIADGGEASGSGSLRSRVKSLPFRSARFVDVDMRIDQPGHHDQITEIVHLREDM